ncbi:MAG TPA: DUF4870 domain-containing protein, partial [Luteolibacter sp.]|nr:DUF4870 domain-containing protein [Luteolibacter sp.]
SEQDSSSNQAAPSSEPQAVTPAPQAAPAASGGSYFDNLDGKKWAMFLHLSQLAGFVIPAVGYAAPIIIWQTQKEKFPELDAHGKMVTNWIISSLIYSVVIGVIAVVTCGAGVVLAIPLALVMCIFPILGGIKAGEGVLWNYPMTIAFLK